MLQSYSSNTLIGENYPLPRDGYEVDRLDFEHFIFHTIIMNGKLYYAPLAEIDDVLDVGTGTGIWAIDFGNRQFPKYYTQLMFYLAERNPNAHVLGIDISPIQPRE
jgi:SAM-dependent methyltransferase